MSYITNLAEPCLTHNWNCIKRRCQPPNPVQAPVDIEQLASLRARLLELLSQGDSRALRLCDEHKDLWRTAYPMQWAKIADCIHRFDFESALLLLQKWGAMDDKVEKVAS